MFMQNLQYQNKAPYANSPVPTEEALHQCRDNGIFSLLMEIKIYPPTEKKKKKKDIYYVLMPQCSSVKLYI